jgi:hypothetical protein
MELIMTTINSIGNNFGFPQNKAAINTLAGGNELPPKTSTVNAASSQFNFKITDISANTLASVGNELHSKGQINAETHLMMTLPRLGSAAMHVGGLPSDTRVLGGHIEDPRKNIDMLQYAKDKLNYIEMVNEKSPLQRVDTKPWEQFISTLEQLDGKENSQGIDLTA